MSCTHHTDVPKYMYTSCTHQIHHYMSCTHSSSCQIYIYTPESVSVELLLVERIKSYWLLKVHSTHHATHTTYHSNTDSDTYSNTDRHKPHQTQWSLDSHLDPGQAPHLCWGPHTGSGSSGHRSDQPPAWCRKNDGQQSVITSQSTLINWESFQLQVNY